MSLEDRSKREIISAYRQLEAENAVKANRARELESQLAAAQQERDKYRPLAIQAALSLVSYELSYGGGGGTDEAIEIAVACGYPDDEPRGEEEIQEWLRNALATPAATPAATDKADFLRPELGASGQRGKTENA